MAGEEKGLRELRGGSVPVCAIGASAGGLQALRQFFSAIGDDLGLAFVVVVHLSPEHPSSLAEILGSCTRMPVHQVDDGPRLRPNCVYVIPPDRELVIKGDDVLARPFTAARGQRAPIDMFFRSVAAGRGDGLAVVLSGAGSDGASGVKAVKEAGGVVFVQDPSEAEYPMMPRSAVATGAADFIAPVVLIAQRIREVVQSKKAIGSVSETEAQDQVKRLIGFLKSSTGHDFSQYKTATLMRRIARRMQVRRRDSLADYADYVRNTPEEAQELFSDLLISVTMFFRDARAFEILTQEAVGPILERLGPDASLRAWVVGCATGEEAYSLAIVLIEQARKRRLSIPIQVFATDLDEGAIATAREGRYPASIEADVPEERLRRFFSREGTHYRVRQEVRDAVLFAHHSVLKEPPFMRLDLVTCRNLLIYMERDLQSQVATLFHYALKSGGFLFLGSAETVDDGLGLFNSVNREGRLYQARQVPRRIPLLLPPMPNGDQPPRASRVRGRTGDFDRSVSAAHLAALERTAPPSALVDAQQRVLHLSPSAGRFILMSGGPITPELPAIVRPELRVDLKVALNRAFEKGEPTLTPTTAVLFNGSRHRVVMQVLPEGNDDEAPSQAMVFFLEGGTIAPASDSTEAGDRPDETRRLQDELRASQERLSASRGDHESAVQELRAANEELQSINEEYRSTAEELETSKEELQSMNEELRTVNSEVKSKLESVSSAHSDLRNIIDSTEIGTLFLDNDMHIRMFTPRVADLFNITEGDIGRAITDFTNRLHHDGIAQEAAKVLHDLTAAESEISTVDGRWLIMRLRPYRTIDDRIDGIVVTFVDITALKTTADRLRESEETYRTLFETMIEGVIVAEPVGGPDGEAVDLFVHEANPSAREFFGLDLVGRRLKGSSDRFEPRWWQVSSRVLRTGEAERAVLGAPPAGRWYEVSIGRSVRNDRWVSISFHDVTEQREAEEALRELEQRQRALIEGMPQLVWRATVLGRWTWASPQWLHYTGQSEAESQGQGWLDVLHPDDRAAAVTAWSQASVAHPLTFETRIWHAAADRYAWFQTRATPVLDSDGNPLEWIGTCTDIDDLRALQEHQGVLVAELQHRTRNLLGVVRSISTQTLAASPDLDAFAERFNSRLEALSRVQGLLSRSGKADITLGTLVRMELDALGVDDSGDRVEVNGPEIPLHHSAVQTLSLGLHELATNALKYGALASGDGRLTITWRTSGEGRDGRLVLTWLEENIVTTPPSPPTLGGYGRKLIEEALPYGLGAVTSFELADETLKCTIDLPLLTVDHPEGT